MNQLTRTTMPIRLIVVFTFAALTLFGSDAAYADVREQCVDPRPENVRLNDLDQVCFSGHPCFVGVRGAWLDLTNSVSRVDGADADFEIVQTGVEQNPSTGSCLPAGNSGREGFVIIRLTNINRDDGSDNIEIRLSRPGWFGATDSDTITVGVERGRKYLENREEFSAVINQLTEFEFRGGKLDQLRLVNPRAGERFLFQSASRAVVRLIFTSRGEHTADEKLRFTGRVPAINEQSGFPIINVRRPPTPGGTFRISRNGNGWGWVSSQPTAISCPSLCSDVFPAHTNVQFTALARADSKFTGWSRGCSGTGLCAIDNGDNTSVFNLTATFVLNYVLDVNITGVGTVTGAGGQISCPGTSCRAESQTRNALMTLTAQAGPGQTFLGWSGACRGQARCDVRLGLPNQTVTARFTQ